MREAKAAVGAMDARDYAVLQALWFFEQDKREATYNKLYTMANSIEKMPRQTFQRRLEGLISKGLVEKREKADSKLNYKPVVYRPTKTGLTAASLNNAMVGLKKELEEQAKSVTLEEIFGRFLRRIHLVVACSPLFLLIGHDGFINYFVYDIMSVLQRIMKERAEAKPEEFVKILPQALALTTIFGGEPLPESTVTNLKEQMRRRGADPDTVFATAKLYEETERKVLAEFDKQVRLSTTRLPSTPPQPP